MGSGLDLKELESLVDELVVFDQSPDEKVAERIAGVDIIFTNKIRLTRELLEASPDLKFIARSRSAAAPADRVNRPGRARGGSSRPARSP